MKVFSLGVAGMAENRAHLLVVIPDPQFRHLTPFPNRDPRRPVRESKKLIYWYVVQIQQSAMFKPAKNSRKRD